MFWRGRRSRILDTSRRRCRVTRQATLTAPEGGHHGGIISHGRGIPSRWESSPTRPARSRSSGSPTPTSPGWSSATSTPRAACSGRHARAACSRTARPTTPSPPRRRRSSSSRTDVDVIFGGIYSSTRQAIKGPAVVEGKTLYIYPEQYEGQESDPLIFCTGPVPAQQVDPFIPWLMRETGAKTFYLPSADYIWPHVHERARPRGRHGQRRRDRRRGVLPARPHGLPRRPSSGSPRAAPTWCSTRSCRPGSRRSSSELYDSGFASRGGHLVCTYFDENFLNMVPAAHVEGLYSCLDYYQAVERSVQPEAARAVRRALPRRREVHRRQRLLGPLPRAAALGRRRDRGRLARPGRRDRGARPRARSPRAPAGRRRWCPASTTCA